VADAMHGLECPSLEGVCSGGFLGCCGVGCFLVGGSWRTGVGRTNTALQIGFREGVVGRRFWRDWCVIMFRIWGWVV
jgi:hypothetical protein